MLSGKFRSGQFPPGEFPPIKRVRVTVKVSIREFDWGEFTGEEELTRGGGDFSYTLIKNSLTNSLLVTVIAQSTANTTNSEKAVYFLSLTSCSRNKLRSHMFFTCKNFVFSDFTWKKIFLQEIVGEWGGRGCQPFPYGPVMSLL